MKDPRGIQRGKCNSCSCGEYAAPPARGQMRCEYCNHTPGEHVMMIQLGKCKCGDCGWYESEERNSYTDCQYCGCAACDHEGAEKFPRYRVVSMNMVISVHPQKTPQKEYPMSRPKSNTVNPSSHYEPAASLGMTGGAKLTNCVSQTKRSQKHNATQQRQQHSSKIPAVDRDEQANCRRKPSKSTYSTAPPGPTECRLLPIEATHATRETNDGNPRSRRLTIQLSEAPKEETLKQNKTLRHSKLEQHRVFSQHTQNFRQQNGQQLRRKPEEQHREQLYRHDSRHQVRRKDQEQLEQESEHTEQSEQLNEEPRGVSELAKKFNKLFDQQKVDPGESRHHSSQPQSKQPRQRVLELTQKMEEKVKFIGQDYIR